MWTTRRDTFEKGCKPLWDTSQRLQHTSCARASHDVDNYPVSDTLRLMNLDKMFPSRDTKYYDNTPQHHVCPKYALSPLNTLFGGIYSGRRSSVTGVKSIVEVNFSMRIGMRIAWIASKNLPTAETFWLIGASATILGRGMEDLQRRLHKERCPADDSPIS